MTFTTWTPFWNSFAEFWQMLMSVKCTGWTKEGSCASTSAWMSQARTTAPAQVATSCFQTGATAKVRDSGHQKERRRVTDEMVRVWNGGAVDHMLTRRSQLQLQNLPQVWVFESFVLEVSQSRKLSILLLASLKWWRSRLVRNNLKNEQKQNNAVLSLEL